MHDTPSRHALLALRVPELPTTDALLKAYASLFPDAPLLVSGEVTDSTSRGLTSEGATFRIRLSPSAIPWRELEGPCETAWHWPQAVKRMKAHTAHLAVEAQGQDDAVALMLSLTRVVAALASITPSLGVYWPTASQVHDVKSFAREAATASRAQLPLYLWLRFGLAREDDGSTSLYTTGLAALDLMEVELPHSHFDPQTLVDRAFNIAHYLAERGPVLEDGHTLGVSAEEKLEVRHLPSICDAERKVYSVRVATP